MDKKLIIGILAVILIVIIVTIGYFLLINNSKETSTTNNKNLNDNITTNDKKDDDETDKNNINISLGKTLVVYYSASGSTKKIAEQISKNLDATLFEITPVDKYTSDDLDWTDDNSRVTREHNDESLRNVKLTTTKVDNWKDYDTVLIGYPIWWGIAAWPVNTFVASNDFNGKTVIPFCTSASSGLGQSGELLEKEAKSGNWLDGHRFRSGASSSDVNTWTDSLKD